ncbi:hypothetical protein O9G_006281 [Rozella allomycis CSF55]|uniref:N-terminal Ras-GEF domain-containing protein n=1 Tax=Rozella allomycis (strain CSF55) TaxID=988480 RepID=A0A075AV05_ROZAC|nr:hypothetical protein O9G_006281 [Rozella allomycis CSF55]|eukprot:EPZ34000.1 hypothetical protein O9G_006281 [Rozella allomycis CSF55]
MLQFIQNEDIITESDIQKLYMYSKLMYNISPHQIFKKAGDICMNFLEHHTDFSQVLEVIGELESHLNENDSSKVPEVDHGRKYSVDSIITQDVKFQKAKKFFGENLDTVLEGKNEHVSNEYWYLETENDIQCIEYSADRSVKAATLDSAIIYLTTADDPNFREAFFTTLLQFTTSKIFH